VENLRRDVIKPRAIDAMASEIVAIGVHRNAIQQAQA
jgi:hypothetical protein